MVLMGLLSFFVSCYVVGSCACRGWFLTNSNLSTGPIKFKLTHKKCVMHVGMIETRSLERIERFPWKYQWPIYENNLVYYSFHTCCTYTWSLKFWSKNGHIHHKWIIWIKVEIFNLFISSHDGIKLFIE